VRVVAVALCALVVTVGGSVGLAGCDDLFVLPLRPDDAGPGGGGRDLDDASVGDLADNVFDLVGWVDGGAVDGGTASTLPTACALLPCTPAMLEGDASLGSGTLLSGCRAFRTLTLTGTVNVDKDARGDGLHLCAERIIVSGLLSAVGRGDIEAMGPGGGKICGSGGSHAGLGADPGMCGVGVTYGDANAPRAQGSGGGSLSGGGGAGGGAIELVAGEISFLLGIVNADGAPGSGALAGGGSGGSVLLRALRIAGTGQITARGGYGFGLAGGGGGGGRVAVYGIDPASSLTLDVSGGASSNGGAGGDVGTIVKSP